MVGPAGDRQLIALAEAVVGREQKMRKPSKALVDIVVSRGCRLACFPFLVYCGSWAMGECARSERRAEATCGCLWRVGIGYVVKRRPIAGRLPTPNPS
jgi:hypothetical protein